MINILTFNYINAVCSSLNNGNSNYDLANNIYGFSHIDPEYEIAKNENLDEKNYENLDETNYDNLIQENFAYLDVDTT